MTIWDVEADAVIAGAGGAGLAVAASICGKLPDAQVILVEKNSSLPNNSRISHGLVAACGTRFQRLAGVFDDSPSMMTSDILRANRYTGDPGLTLACSTNSAAVVHWFADELQVPITFAQEAEWIGHRRPRMHAHPERSGVPLVDALQRFVLRQAGVALADRTPLSRLIYGEGGNVEGIETGHVGAIQSIRGEHVVLATGGFGANHELLRKYTSCSDFPYLGSQTSTGEAVLVGLSAGAQLESMSGYEALGFATPHGTRISPGVVAAGGIVVDGQGRRFCREDVSHSSWAANLSESADGIAIALWDQEIHAKLAETATMRESDGAGAIVQGADVSELSATLGLECATLASTLAEYNDAVTSRLDRLGRQLLPRQLRPPFYAARIVAALAHTQGGLKIDVHGRVLNTRGIPIPHLFAVGGAAMGLSGPLPDGYLAGNGLLTTYTLGWMVGQFIADRISTARMN